MNQEEDEDRRVRELAGEIVKLIPDRRKIKTDFTSVPLKRDDY